MEAVLDLARRLRHEEDDPALVPTLIATRPQLELLELASTGKAPKAKPATTTCLLATMMPPPYRP